MSRISAHNKSARTSVSKKQTSETSELRNRVSVARSKSTVERKPIQSKTIKKKEIHIKEKLSPKESLKIFKDGDEIKSMKNYLEEAVKLNKDNKTNDFLFLPEKKFVDKKAFAKGEEDNAEALRKNYEKLLEKGDKTVSGEVLSLHTEIAQRTLQASHIDPKELTGFASEDLNNEKVNALFTEFYQQSAKTSSSKDRMLLIGAEKVIKDTIMGTPHGTLASQIQTVSFADSFTHEPLMAGDYKKGATKRSLFNLLKIDSDPELLQKKELLNTGNEVFQKSFKTCNENEAFVKKILKETMNYYTKDVSSTSLDSIGRINAIESKIERETEKAQINKVEVKKLQKQIDAFETNITEKRERIPEKRENLAKFMAENTEKYLNDMILFLKTENNHIDLLSAREKNITPELQNTIDDRRAQNNANIEKAQNFKNYLASQEGNLQQLFAAELARSIPRLYLSENTTQTSDESPLLRGGPPAPPQPQLTETERREIFGISSENSEEQE